MARQSFTQCLVNHLSDPIQYSLQSNSRFIQWHDISTSRMFWQDIAVNLDLFVKDCSCVTNVWYKHYGEKYFSSFIMTSSCKEAFSVLMLCVPVFTSSSSALLGCPSCGVSTVATCHIQCNFLCLCEFFFFTRKQTKQKTILCPKMDAADC